MQNIMAPDLTFSPWNSALESWINQSVSFLIRCTDLGRNRLKTSRKYSKTSPQKLKTPVMVWDLNKCKGLLNPKIKFMDEYILKFKNQHVTSIQ